MKIGLEALKSTGTRNRATKFLPFVIFVLMVALFMTLAFSSPVLAHSVGWRKVTMPSVALEFFYSTGDAMAYQEARVFSPTDEKFSWQMGRTDENGRFAFTPNVVGTWRVIVKDDEGHLSEAALEIVSQDLTGASVASDENATGGLLSGVDLAIRAALGVSLLFNVAAFVSLRSSQRKKS